MMRSDSRLGVRGEVDGAFALVDSCTRWSDPVACGRCVTADGGQCESRGGGTTGQGHQPAWPHLNSLPELPYIHQLETNSLESGIQS